MSFGVRTPGPGKSSWGSDAPPAPPGTEPSPGSAWRRALPGCGLPGGGPSSCHLPPPCSSEDLASWEVWTGCPSLLHLVPQAPAHKHLHSFPAPERTCAFCRERGAQAGRPRGESDHLHGQVHSAGASPLPRPAHAAPLPPSLPAPWASSWQVLLPWPPRLLAPPQGHPLTETFLLRACDPWGPRDKVPQTGLNSAGV